MVCARTRTICLGLCVTALILLSLTEHALAAFTNVALNKETYQQWSWYWNSDKAVDGNDNSDYSSWSCTHTSTWYQNKPWWTVDLGREYAIFKVSVKNRGDCCSGRLANFDVSVHELRWSPRELCFHRDPPVASGAWLHKECLRPLVGRFVTIQIMGPSSATGTQILTLCEVQVWGQELQTFLVEEKSSITIPCASAATTYHMRAWYRGIHLLSGEPDTDQILYTQTATAVVFDQDPGTRKGFSLDQESFNLTINSVSLVENTLTCMIENVNVSTTEYTKLNVHIKPKIRMEGLDITTFRYFTRVMVTCTIDRLFPAIPSHNFRLRWGWQYAWSTKTRNEDLSYNYTVTMTKVVTADDDGKTIRCIVYPARGNPVTVKKKISVHNRNPEVEAVLGLVVIILLGVACLIIAHFSSAILALVKKLTPDQSFDGQTGATSGTKRKEKKLTFDLNDLTAEMYDDGI